MRKALVALLILLFGCSAPARVIEFSTLDQGVVAPGITEQVNEVISDSESFGSFWRLISAAKIPPPAAPAVDFTKDMVIAVSPGQMNSGGYSVEITNVIQIDGKLRVTVVVNRPTGVVTTVMTQPYHIIRLKKSDLPVEYIWEEHLLLSTDEG